MAQVTDCAYFSAHRCHSCTWLETPYDTQLRAKDRAVQRTLELPPAVWQPPFASEPWRFRNKAKMVVGGAKGAPTLGILGDDQRGIDLTGCGLHEQPLEDALLPMQRWMRDTRLTPYRVPERSGEVKHAILTVAPSGELALRLVLRSIAQLERIRDALPALQHALPRLGPVTASIEPAHIATLDGGDDVPLTQTQQMWMRAHTDLLIGPRSFFQTNTRVAAALYRTAAEWAAHTNGAVLDLFCGVGGFALALDAASRDVVGVEISDNAVEAATAAARHRGSAARFIAGPADAHIERVRSATGLVIVNPPRRGIGPALAEAITESGASDVLYSSCNPETLARDLASMPGLRVERAQLFDMFPHTGHAEVLIHAVRQD